MFSYSSKNGIFKDLIEIIQKIQPSFEASTLIDAAFLNRIQDDIEQLYSTSNLCIWLNREYLFFKSEFRSVVDIGQLYYPIGSVKSYSLFKSALSKRYEELVYRHRNRCAHNTLIIALKQYRLYHSNDTASLAWLQVSLFTWLAIPV